jgi:hypothetical protein
MQKDNQNIVEDLNQAISIQEEDLLNSLLSTLNINKIDETNFQKMLDIIKSSNKEIFRIIKALESQEIIDYVLKNKLE